MQKPELTFICSWEKDKTRTWSGTVWGLFNALSQHYSIDNIDVAYTRPLWRRALDKLRRASGDMSVSNILRQRGRINKACESKTVFQFAEYCNTPTANTYLYIDLNVEWLWRTFHTDRQLCGYFFNGCFPDIKMFDRRQIMQREYIATASGVLCMGHWLKEYLINHCGVPLERVTAVGGV